MPLSVWLEEEDRDPSPSTDFETSDVTEHQAPTAEIFDELAEAVLLAKSSREFLEAAAPLIDWEFLADRLAAPTEVSAKRGDFGEVLSALWLEEEWGLRVPVSKLRHQIHPLQMLPGTDQVALEVEGTDVIRLHLLETKLRTTRYVGSAKDAYIQHRDRRQDQLNSHLAFILEKLWEQGSALFEPLVEHLASRTDEPDDAYFIALIFDVACWSEKNIEKLKAIAGDVGPLQVQVFQIENLKDLIDKACDRIGMDCLAD